MKTSAMTKIADGDGISATASKDDIMSYLTVLEFNKEEEENAEVVSADTVAVVKTEEEKAEERAAK